MKKTEDGGTQEIQGAEGKIGTMIMRQEQLWCEMGHVYRLYIEFSLEGTPPPLLQQVILKEIHAQPLCCFQPKVVSHHFHIFPTNPWNEGQKSQIVPPIPGLRLILQFRFQGTPVCMSRPDNHEIRSGSLLILAYPEAHLGSLILFPVLYYTCQY